MYKPSVSLSPVKYPLLDHHRREEMNHKDGGVPHSVCLLMKGAVHCSVVGSSGDCCTILLLLSTLSLLPMENFIPSTTKIKKIQTRNFPIFVVNWTLVSPLPC